MDDRCSNTSYEDVLPQPRPPHLRPDWPGAPFDSMSRQERLVEKMKALIVGSGAGKAPAKELAEDEEPDVCYVLQYQSQQGNTIEVHRSAEPINFNSKGGKVNNSCPERPPGKLTEPVFEIVTDVTSKSVKLSDHDTTKKITFMRISSPFLINAIDAAADYPGLCFSPPTVPGRFDAPYADLVHLRTSLARYKTSQPIAHPADYASITCKHIDVLLEFLETTLGEQLRAEKALHDSSTPKATFGNLWMLYQPGEVIFARVCDKWTPFILNSCWGTQGAYEVRCWHIVVDQGKLRRVVRIFHVGQFSGEQAIRSLPVVPGRFFKNDDGEDDSARQIGLGKVMWQLIKSPAYMSYNGPLVEVKGGASGEVNGRVMIDRIAYKRQYPQGMEDPRNPDRRSSLVPEPASHQRQVMALQPNMQLSHVAPRCGCIHCNAVEREEQSDTFAGFDDLNPEKNEAPGSDLYYLVLHKVVPGFILSTRLWAYFYVELLENVTFDKEAFEYLILDEDIKTVVKALVGKFRSSGGQVTSWPKDFVANKGQGRIFLLHGEPGVGKTATAECVAELAQRPLLSLTSGDLAETAFNLEYYLGLGERFGAIVLIDEADVYLEARQSQDIARNRLVSVFLRALEYYGGVLFLTTNRVSAFDAAFTSRIHVALHYKPLKQADRERIWLNGFERLERESGGRVRVSVATREYAYDGADVRALRWNGREIRNALQTVVALAEAEAVDDEGVVAVTDRHLRAVVKMSRGFKDFLRERRRGECDDTDEDE